jgi:hypothetical protein
MKFGPAEMAQMMDGAKALLTVTMISSIGIGLVLGVIVAFFTAFFRGGLDRNRAEPRLTNGQSLAPNSSSEPNTVYPGDQLAREHISVSNELLPDNRVTHSYKGIFSFILSFLLTIIFVVDHITIWE